MLSFNQLTRSLAVASVTFVLLSSVAIAQDNADAKKQQQRLSRWERQPHLTDAKVHTTQEVFKKTPQGELKLHIWSPEKQAADRPCIVFFFGGGWKSGSPQQFARQSEYLASRGMVAISAEYRISGTHKTTPDACVEDAKSAIRWVRAHAQQLGIDPNKVIAGGGSAGGHLAAATALVTDFDAQSDDHSISAVPNALVLFNPALDLTLLDRDITDSQGNSIAKAISPTLYLSKKSPPAIIFFGTDDKLSTHGVQYAAKAKELGLDAQLWWAADQGHGFFNNPPWLQVTTRRADHFLKQLGYLSGPPTVAMPDIAPALKRDGEGQR